MAKILINVKTETAVKRNAQKLAEELGISLSDVVNASLRNFIRTREVRFSDIPEMTPELEHLLGPIERDLQTRKGLSRAIEDEQSLRTHLDAL